MKIYATAWYCLLIAILTACQQNSNELVPIYKTKNFSNDIFFNGIAFGRANFRQVIQPGEDSLSFTLKNLGQKAWPKGTRFLIWFEQENNNTNPFQFSFVHSLNAELVPDGISEAKLISNHPELPFDKEIVKIYPLNLMGTIKDTVSFAGFYSSGKVQVKYSGPPNDSFQDFSFVSGFVSADGITNFIYKKNSDYFRIDGRFLKGFQFLNGSLKKNESHYSLALDSIHSKQTTDSLILSFLPTPLQENLETGIKLLFQRP